MINKKTLFVTAVLILFSIAPHVLAQGFVPLAEIEGLTKGVEANTEGLAVFFNNLYKFAIGMATVLAVIMIIWGGIEYSWQDIPGAKSNGKERIQQAILGLVLVLSPALVFSIINPSILNLSINLPKLDTKSGPPTTSGGPTTVQEVRKGTTKNTGREGEIIGFGDGLYTTSQSGTYCFQIAPFTDPEDRATKNYICSGGFNGCLRMYNDANLKGSAYTTKSECRQY